MIALAPETLTTIARTSRHITRVPLTKDFIHDLQSIAVSAARTRQWSAPDVAPTLLAFPRDISAVILGAGRQDLVRTNALRIAQIPRLQIPTFAWTSVRSVMLSV